MKVLAPLRIPAFRRLYGAQVVAYTGDGLDFLAIITIVVFQWERGPGALSLLALAAAIPLVTGAPVFGYLADRYEPRTVMIAANVVRALGMLGIAMADSLAMVCLLSAVVAFGTGCNNATQHRFIRNHLSEGLLLQANSLRLTTERMIIGMFGPGAAGVLITIVGAHHTLLITSACFGIAAVALGFLPTSAAPTDEEKSQRLTSRMSAGFRHVWGSPPLRLTIIGMACAYTFSMMFDVLLPIWYRDMGGSPGYVGAAMMSMGLGGAAGALLVAKYGDRFNLLSVMAVSALAIGAVVGLMGVAGLAAGPELLAVWLVCVAGIGVASAAAIVSYNTLIQRLTSKDLMGRVGAVSGMAVSAPTIVGPAVAPMASAVLGVNGVFILCGAGLAALGLFILGRVKTYDLAPFGDGGAQEAVTNPAGNR